MADPSGNCSWNRTMRPGRTPLDATDAESFYYAKQIAAKTPLVVSLTDGEEIRGHIGWYDGSSIAVCSHDGRRLLIQKHDGVVTGIFFY